MKRILLASAVLLVSQTAAAQFGGILGGRINALGAGSKFSVGLQGYNQFGIQPGPMSTEGFSSDTQIAAGELTVHDYTSDDSCPALSF